MFSNWNDAQIDREKMKGQRIITYFSLVIPAAIFIRIVLTTSLVREFIFMSEIICEHNVNGSRCPVRRSGVTGTEKGKTEQL